MSYAEQFDRGRTTWIKNNNTKQLQVNKQVAQLEDNRQSTLIQKKIQGAAKNSPQAAKTTQLQRLMHENGAEPESRNGAQERSALPENIRTGVENLSGYSMDDVRVHYNSNQPAQLQAHAFAEGEDIYVAPGQEQHLPHEAWHVVQQKQGRVRPSPQMKGGVKINTDSSLEQEADRMGNKALQLSSITDSLIQRKASKDIVQRVGNQTSLTTPGLSGHTGGSQVDSELEIAVAKIRESLKKEIIEQKKQLSPAENQAAVQSQERSIFIEKNKPGIVQQYVLKLNAKQPPFFGDTPPAGWMSTNDIREIVNKFVSNFFEKSKDHKKAYTVLWNKLNELR